MPGMTGDKVCDEITKVRADIPIIICSGFSEQVSPFKTAREGATAYPDEALRDERVFKCHSIDAGQATLNSARESVSPAALYTVFRDRRGDLFDEMLNVLQSTVMHENNASLVFLALQ